MVLALVRTIVLCASNLLAFIVLCLSAYTLSRTVDFYYNFSALGVATSVLHLCSVTPMIIIGFLRDGAWTSYLIFELGVLSFLWVMWLATGGQTAATLGGAVECTGTFCNATQVIAAFSFLIWAMLFGYSITLLTFAIKAATAGQNVWVTDVKQVRWMDGPTNFEKPVLGTPHGTPHPTLGNATYPPGMASPVTPHPQYPQYPQQQGVTYQV